MVCGYDCLEFVLLFAYLFCLVVALWFIAVGCFVFRIALLINDDLGVVLIGIVLADLGVLFRFCLVLLDFTLLFIVIVCVCWFEFVC